MDELSRNSGGEAVVTVLMTAPDAGAAEGIVRSLLDQGLVACGNVVPGAVSVYRWRGRVERAEEAVAILKTVERLVPRVLEVATTSHPYDIPELLVQEVAGGSAEYLEWVRSECDGKARGEARADATRQPVSTGRQRP